MKADLHIHTTFSDGISTPKEIVDSAIEKGLDCVCITDHNCVDGAFEAKKYAADKNILVVPGIEVMSASGDILGINMKSALPNGLSAEETIKEIRKQGGIAVIPHPFRCLFMGFHGGGEKIKEAKPDGVECFDASDFFEAVHKKTRDFVEENNFCFTAGSDAHRKELVGLGYMDFPQKISSEKDLVFAIMNKTGVAKGRSLGWRELFKNISHARVEELFDYIKCRKA